MMQTIQNVIQNKKFTRICIVVISFALAQFGILDVYASDQTYEYVTKWGSTGIADGEFRHPHGIDADSSGNLYITVRDNLEIQKFTSNGKFIDKWASNTTRDGEYRDIIIKENVPRSVFRSTDPRDGEFLDPHGVDVNSIGNVFIVDAALINVQKFDSNGKFITKWGTNGTGDGEFYLLEGIGIDSFDNTYVVDAGNKRIQKFDSNGKFITKWGTNGTGDGEFRYPYGIAVDSLNNVYVSDKLNSKVEKFTNDGEFITKWGTKGTGDGEFRYPEDLAVDLEGNVYVTDSNNDRIQKFSPTS
jgi:hypothetical protein